MIAFTQLAVQGQKGGVRDRAGAALPAQHAVRRSYWVTVRPACLHASGLAVLCSAPDAFSLLIWSKHVSACAQQKGRADHAACARCRVVHLDLKSSNVLIGADGTAKISDVGLAALLSKSYLSRIAPTGTFAWVAPRGVHGGARDRERRTSSASASCCGRSSRSSGPRGAATCASPGCVDMTISSHDK